MFVGQAGEYLDDSAVRWRFKRARDEAGLRPLRFQDLRHTFGSVAIRPVDPRVLQEWMGHSNISTTQIYMRCTPQAVAARTHRPAESLVLCVQIESCRGTGVWNAPRGTVSSA